MTCSIAYSGGMVSKVRWSSSTNHSISVSKGQRGHIDVMASAPTVESYICTVKFEPEKQNHDETAQNVIQFRCHTEEISIECKRDGTNYCKLDSRSLG